MPDSIRIEPLDQRAPRMRSRRLRTEPATKLETIPAEWRELLTRWVKRGGNSRWETLLKDAGTANLTLAGTPRELLVRQGWAIAVEERKHGDWWPQSLELRNLGNCALPSASATKNKMRNAGRQRVKNLKAAATTLSPLHCSRWTNCPCIALWHATI